MSVSSDSLCRNSVLFPPSIITIAIVVSSIYLYLYGMYLFPLFSISIPLSPQSVSSYWHAHPDDTRLLAPGLPLGGRRAAIRRLQVSVISMRVVRTTL